LPGFSQAGGRVFGALVAGHASFHCLSFASHLAVDPQSSVSVVFVFQPFLREPFLWSARHCQPIVLPPDLLARDVHQLFAL